MRTHRDNVRMLMDDLAVAQATRRLRRYEQEAQEEVDRAMWVIVYGLGVVAIVVFVGIIWWGW